MRARQSPIPRNEVIDDLDDRSANIPIRYSITSYGADYPVDGLVNRIESGAIYVPDFQRKYVWPVRLASRFIESLLLGLPVPGIFLAREQESSRLIVIDGQQRLWTLHSFYTGIAHNSRKEFKLDLNNPGYVSPYHGATYKSLSRDDRQKLDDSILHATVVRQDEPSDDQSSIYAIFERLNTGGMNLQPQEIRASIFHGEFSQLLGSLNDIPHWRRLYGPKNSRLRDQELILRFFAFYFMLESYRRPMKEFLNLYMGKNRNLRLQSGDQLTSLFDSTVTAID
jgi:uncharacterized protein with ParB-like and HNH nuclease domain